MTARQRRVGQVAAGAVGLALLLTFVLVGYTRYSRGHIAVSVVGYRSLSTAATITFEIDKPAAWTASCRLRARTEDFTEVGHVDGLVVGPGAKQTLTRTFPTTRRAFSIDVQQCSRTG